ncbi:DEAD/DEAH box helicase [Acinetobacter pittii]|uniref:DEAD/DEAH box helicase n=1 Tax=Acinetobacter pittii TaxID=48296 RepID=UPI0013D7528B|nr:DEAD/DEAH box helicase [Acinetobacter pittii]
MSNLPKPIEFHLNSKQFIADEIPTLLRGNTLIVGGTGTGKSSYVLEILSKSKQVILLCPLVAQVKQLEDLYQSDQFAFIHGKKNIPKNDIRSFIKKHLVMTYDQFSKFAPHLSKDAVIVVDEAQKLYAVGYYREQAIQSILHIIQSQKFDHVLFLTATLTQYLFEKLNIQISHFYSFSKLSNNKRSIRIINPQTVEPLSWIWEVQKRLEKNRKQNVKKVVIARVNDIKLANQVKEMYEQKGFKTQLINREQITSHSCMDLLSLERISTEFDVVICTSILDEAINLKNSNNEIDSVHIIGNNAHPEEIVQFIGRLRTATPPVYIHLPGPIDDYETNCDKLFTKYSKANKSTYLELTAFLHKIELSLDKEKFKGFADLINTKIDKIQIMNGLITDLIECKGFWSDNNIIKLNTASIVARFYRLDIQQCYSNLNYLKYRLLQLLPNGTVKIISSDVVIPEAIKNAFEQSEKTLKDRREEGIPKVIGLLFECLRDLKGFKNFREKIEDSIFDDDSVYYEIQEDTVYKGIFDEAMILSEKLDNLKDVQEALVKNRTNHVIKIAHEYQNNPVVFSVIQQLRQALDRKDFREKTHGYDDITHLMNTALQKIAYSKPILETLRKYLSQYVEVFDDDSILFQDGKSINFLKKYCHVKIFNDKKHYKHKKIKFLNLTAFGYSFYDVSVRQKKFITINNIRYNARTGYEDTLLDDSD